MSWKPNPLRRRADGQPKGLYLERLWPWIVGPDHNPPAMHSADRTRSRRRRAGSRRNKRLAGAS